MECKWCIINSACCRSCLFFLFFSSSFSSSSFSSFSKDVSWVESVVLQCGRGPTAKRIWSHSAQTTSECGPSDRITPVLCAVQVWSDHSGQMLWYHVWPEYFCVPRWFSPSLTVIVTRLISAAWVWEHNSDLWWQQILARVEDHEGRNHSHFTWQVDPSNLWNELGKSHRQSLHPPNNQEDWQRSLLVWVSSEAAEQLCPLDGGR